MVPKYRYPQLQTFIRHRNRYDTIYSYLCMCVCVYLQHGGCFPPKTTLPLLACLCWLLPPPPLSQRSGFDRFQILTLLRREQRAAQPTSVGLSATAAVTRHTGPLQTKHPSSNPPPCVVSRSLLRGYLSLISCSTHDRRIPILVAGSSPVLFVDPWIPSYFTITTPVRRRASPTASSHDNSSSGIIMENSNFDTLKREATKLERNLEDKVSRYQQVRRLSKRWNCAVLGDIWISL
jgi:hypothetical protein